MISVRREPIVGNPGKGGRMKKNIVLIGFMGSGKTTVGRRVAASLGLDFYDTDEYLKKSEKMPLAQIIAKKGQKYFEGAQRFAVMNLCENENALISTGGNTVCDRQNLDMLKKNGILVWLRASAETVYQNTKDSHNKRPALVGQTVEGIAQMLAENEPYYKECDICISVDGRDMDRIVETVQEEIKKLNEQ
ncbi:MAG: shikimate kinase [Clostridia bacterium]|nr:shikimate kinase [Clostridia bacterium]